MNSLVFYIERSGAFSQKMDDALDLGLDFILEGIRAVHAAVANGSINSQLIVPLTSPICRTIRVASA